MTDPKPLSQSRLGDYAKCPRYYEFDRQWDVETPDETVRYVRRGTALHNAIEDTWRYVHPDVDENKTAVGNDGATVDGGDESTQLVDPMGTLPVPVEDVRDYALDAFDRHWTAHVPRDAYRTRSHFEHDRDVSRAAIVEFFAEEGPGIDHLRQAIACEATIEYRFDDIRFRGRLDLIMRTERGLHVIDYKTSLNSVISTHSYYGPKTIAEHGTESYNHRYIKSLMQAVLYRRGVRTLDCYEEGMDVEFSFYGLRDEVERHPHEDGLVPEVAGSVQRMGEFLDEHHDEAWALIREYATGIREEAFEPEPWELIVENVCDDCAYQDMCPDYLAKEVGRLE